MWMWDWFVDWVDVKEVCVVVLELEYMMKVVFKVDEWLWNEGGLCKVNWWDLRWLL